MTRLDPSLMLLRLVVARHGAVAYDQKFHAGVNIIRGTNSHGKSSIADFIFFVLGGEIHQWKPEAGACDNVFAEVRLNGAVVTLKREVTDLRSQPLHVFFGDYESAVKSAVVGWKIFPYRRTDQIESFSQVLFRAMQMPETQGEGTSHITMHQLLRLIYVDQLTPPDSLFRTEQFDSGLIRKTVLDYLLGLYDNALYLEELQLREARRQLEATRGQLKQLEAILDKAEIDTDPKKLESRVNQAKKELAAVNTELATVQDRQRVAQATLKNELAPVAAALAGLKKQSYVLTNEIQELALEVEDSRQFVAALEKRLAALADAAVTREVLGSLPLHFCPQCLAPLKGAEAEHICSLCKQELETAAAKSHAARMRQEIALQIKESKGLLDEKVAGLVSKQGTAVRLSEQMRVAQAEFERLSQTVQTARDQKIDQLFQNKGGLERALEDYLQKSKVVQVIAAQRQQEKVLTLRVQELAISITKRQSDQKARYFQAEAVVQNYTLGLVRNDLTLEESFKVAQALRLDPENNTFALDGRNQFSASSVTYLKNSIHFALLFASLDLAFSRYPRFLLCDNIEDKGMTVERSRNFQRNIVALSKAAKVEHQIIFTTSMIDPALDTAEFTIGPNYVDGRKTLEIKAALPAVAKA